MHHAAPTQAHAACGSQGGHNPCSQGFVKHAEGGPKGYVHSVQALCSHLVQTGALTERRKGHTSNQICVSEVTCACMATSTDKQGRPMHYVS